MTALIVLAHVLGYIGIAGFVHAVLASNYAALKKADLLPRYSDPDIAQAMGAVFWPFFGVALLIHHRLHYGITRMDRRLARSTNTRDLRRALEESRRQEIARMERDLGIGKDRR